MESCFTYPLVEKLRKYPLVKVADMCPKMINNELSLACICYYEEFIYYISNNDIRFLSMLRKSSSISNFLKLKNVCIISNENIYYSNKENEELFEYVIEYGPLSGIIFHNFSIDETLKNKELILWSLLYIYATKNQFRLELVVQYFDPKPVSLLGNFVFPNYMNSSFAVIMCNLGFNDKLFIYYDWLGHIYSLDDIKQKLIINPTEFTRSRLVSYVL